MNQDAGGAPRAFYLSTPPGGGPPRPTAGGAITFVTAFVVAFGSAAMAEDAPPAGPQNVVHRVAGLFSPDREADLRKALEKVEGVRLVSVEFDYAEATFEYDAARLFPGAKPEQVVERLNEWLRNASNHTLGVKARCTVPRDKLTRVEIPIAGLDCKACCLAAYEILARQDGVEQATASFKDRKATALIDPAKTDRAKLEAALREREVPAE
jgi:copper chaperone CopZ